MEYDKWMVGENGIIQMISVLQTWYCLFIFWFVVFIDKYILVDNVTMSEDKRLEAVQAALKAYPDFPKPGILFQDIFGVFSNPTALEEKFYRRS